MEYLDFALELEARGPGAYEVEVIASPAGELTAPLVLPYDAAERARRLDALDAARVGSGAPNGGAPGAASSPEADDPARSFGRALFTALFHAEVLACYRTSLREARRQGKGLRLSLRVEAPELALLPWEYLYDAAERDFVVLSPETPLVRYLELGTAPERLATRPPIRILGMVAAPADLDPLDVEQERRWMAEAVRPQTDAGHVELTWLPGGTWRDLQAALRRGPWHVFHFVGHGGFDRATGEGLLYLAGDDGAACPFDATQVGRLLDGHAPLRLAVLNACEGATASATDLFSSTGATLVRRGVPAVVSMQYPISDRAALEFARTFYGTLVEGLPVEGAVAEARRALAFALDGATEWATPVLHTHAPDGGLFALDAAVAVEAAVTHPAPPASTPVATHRDALLALAAKVQAFWVDGVLAHALGATPILGVGLDAMPALVDSVWGTAPLPPGGALVGVFDALRGSILVLGDAGTGKTTALLTLARDLLGRARRDPGASEPASPEVVVPVVFPLASWSGGLLADWIADELSAKYQVAREVGHAWVGAGHVLPLLDGLDEVPADRRAACVAAVNTFSGGGQARVVVTCGLRAYTALPTRLQVNGAVRLRPLTRAQVEGAVAGAGPRFATLAAALRRDSSLFALAQTPFLFGLMTRAYADAPPDALVADGFTPLDTRRAGLMAAYADRQWAAAGAATPPVERPRAERWLATLARGMRRHAQAVFLIESLQPTWLPSRGARRLYVAASRLAGGLAVGFVGGLVAALLAALVLDPLFGLAVPFRGDPGAPLGDRLGQGAAEGARFGLVLGLLTGLTAAVLDALRLERSARTERLARLPAPLRLGLATGAFALAFTALAALTGEPGALPLAGVLAGALWAVRQADRPLDADIQTAEAFVWAWGAARRSALRAFGFGTVVGALVGVAVVFDLRLRGGLHTVPPADASVAAITVGLVAVLFGLAFAAAGLSFGGLRRTRVEPTTTPARGLGRMLRTAAREGGRFGAFFGVAFGVAVRFAAPPAEALVAGLVLGVGVGALAALWFGGLDALHHGLLRLLLRRGDHLPLRLAPFLAFAADGLGFLHTVGGGYVFLHRYLLDHFAGPTQEPPVEAGRTRRARPTPRGRGSRRAGATGRGGRARRTASVAS